MTDAYVQGTDCVGGVVGCIQKRVETGRMWDCSFEGKVRGNNYVGGFCGSDRNTALWAGPDWRKVCAKADVAGNDYVGGLCGSLVDYQSSYATSAMGTVYAQWKGGRKTLCWWADWRRCFYGGKLLALRWIFLMLLVR